MIRISDVVCVVLLGTLAGILAPESRGEGYRKLVRMIAGLALILVIADTALTAVQNFRGFFDQLEETVTEEWNRSEDVRREAEAWVTERGIRNVEEGAAALVRSRFHPKGEVQVIAASSADSTGMVSIDALLIRLESSSDAQLREIESYLSGLLSCPCHAENVQNHAEKGETEA